MRVSSQKSREFSATSDTAVKGIVPPLLMRMPRMITIALAVASAGLLCRCGGGGLGDGIFGILSALRFPSRPPGLPLASHVSSPSPSSLPPPIPVCNVDPPNQCAWYNGALTYAQRLDSLLAALTPPEKLTILAGNKVDRLHVPADGFNEALHGIAWSGRATVFPCPMALGATFDPSLVRSIGAAVAREGLAKHWHSTIESNALSFFAPNVNIVRDVRWGRAQETYGEDPTLTGMLCAAYVMGMQYLDDNDDDDGGSKPSDNDGGSVAVRAVAKHFAAYNLESNFAGRTTLDEIANGDGQYRLSYDATVSYADMMQTFLPAFESIVIDANVRGIMCAYNSVNGTPLCANELLQTQLRDRMGFDGIVITDCDAIGFMTSRHNWTHPDTGLPYTAVEATAATLEAGTDLNCGEAYGTLLPTAYRDGLVTLHQMDVAVGRALRGYFELGLFHDAKAAAADVRRQYRMDIVDSAQHRALAKRAAIQGMVLLKNIDDALPLGGATGASTDAALSEARPIKLAVIGPNANRTLTLASNYAGCKDRAGGPILPSCTFVTPLQGIVAAASASNGKFDPEVEFVPGVDIDTPDASGIPPAVSAAARADVAIVVTGLITCQENGPECQEAEARDRSTPVNADGTDNPFSTENKGRDYGIGLPGRQLELLQTIANSTAGTTTIILVVMSGSAVDVTWAAASPRIASIVQLFYPGVLGGEALADVLTGKASPGGKLPVTVPTGEDQLPKNYLDQSMQAGEGRTHRYFRGKPLYPFGYGLSYSTFSYSNLLLSHTAISSGLVDVDKVLTVTISVTNLGEFAGSSDETVLVVARPHLAEPPTYVMSVPMQQLVGFTKVQISAGSTVKVSVDVPLKNLRLVGPDNHSFELLPGRYELHVGGRGPGGGVGVDDDRVQRPLTADLYVK